MAIERQQITSIEQIDIPEAPYADWTREDLEHDHEMRAAVEKWVKAALAAAEDVVFRDGAHLYVEALAEIFSRACGVNPETGERRVSRKDLVDIYNLVRRFPGGRGWPTEIAVRRVALRELTTGIPMARRYYRLYQQLGSWREVVERYGLADALRVSPRVAESQVAAMTGLSARAHGYAELAADRRKVLAVAARLGVKVGELPL